MTPETARVLLHAFIDGELDAASTIELKAQIDVSPAFARNWLAYPLCKAPCKPWLHASTVRLN